MQSEENFYLAEEFLKIAEEIIIYNEVNGLAILLKYYKDEEYDHAYGSFGWVQQSLRHIIEKFGRSENDYVKALIDNLYVMFPEGESWAMYLINTIINTIKDEYEENSLLDNIEASNKSFVLRILNKMIKENFGRVHIAQNIKNKINKSL